MPPARCSLPTACLLGLGLAACVHETVVGPVGPDGDDPDAAGLIACEARERIIDRDVEIPRGFGCVFVDVEIRGNLVLARGAHLSGTGLLVRGNVEARRADRLHLTGSRVEGNLRFDDGRTLDLRETRIDGNVRLRSNEGALAALGNTIDGDLELRRNRNGPLTLSTNTVHGDLECKDNQPPPEGTGNQVHGKAEAQCRGF